MNEIMKETKKFFTSNNLNKGYAKAMPEIKTESVNANSQLGLGYLPPVQILAEYEELFPGFVEKLLKIAEQEQKHRHHLELEEQKKAQKAEILGKFFGMIMLVVLAVVVFLLCIIGSEEAGIILTVLSFSTVVFFYFRSNKKIDRSRKNHSEPQNAKFTRNFRKSVPNRQKR